MGDLTKACIKCNKAKPLDEFPRDSRTRDGHSGRCRLCRNEYQRARANTPEGRRKGREAQAKWRAENHERHLAYRRENERAWRKNNPEKYKAKSKRDQAYQRSTYKPVEHPHLMSGHTVCHIFKTCPECGETKHRDEYYTSKIHHDSKDRACKECKKAYQRTPERRAYQRKKMLLKRYTEPEKMARQKDKYQAARKQRVAAQSDGTVTREAMMEVMGERDHCPYCGVSFDEIPAAPDHMDPIFRGGLHSASNLLAVCKKCNTRKRARTFTDWARGLDPKHRIKALRIYYEKKGRAIRAKYAGDAQLALFQ